MRRVRRVLLVLLALVAAPVAAWAQPVDGRILVMPFDNVSHEPRIVWVGEAASVLIADDLNALGAAAITRDERREEIGRAHV